MYCQTPGLGLRVDCAFTQQEHKTKFIMMRLVKDQTRLITMRSKPDYVEADLL